MKFIFNERKAAQAAAYLLRLNGGRMKYLKLIKLLYLADRESLLRTGRPITGDCYVSMDNGPVLSRIYDLIREEPKSTDSPWFRYVSKPEDYSVRLLHGAETDELSGFELSLLQEFFERFKDMDQFDLADLTHTICPEWRDPEGSSSRIFPEDILTAGSKSDREIQQIAEESLDLQLIARLQLTANEA